MQNKTFNLVVAGVGGQGIITLLKIIDEAAFLDGFDLRSSELHGLSQRGGSVLAHIRFGKKVYSPMVQAGKADLILGLEITESLRALNFASKKTSILVNKYLMPFLGGLGEKEILERFPAKNIRLVEASKICKEALENDVLSSVFLLGTAVRENLLPLKKEHVLKAIENIISEKHKEINIKAFNLAFN